MQQTFGVDIGNSGMRVVELDLRRQILGDMLRIDWCPIEVPVGLPAKRNSPALPTRYRPDDPQWLSVLDRYIESSERRQAAQPPRWLISSVRRDALRLLQDHLSLDSATERDAHIASHEAHVDDRRQVEVVTCHDLPLDIRVDSPTAVGVDRLLAALAAMELTPARPAIVIQAGSAVTVDLIGAPRDAASLNQRILGTFEGGAILPGVPMMLRLLGKGADLLPEIDAADLLQLPPLPGKNTEAAMMCGAASALVGGVIHLVDRYRQHYGQQVPIIISGGDGMRLSPYLAAPLIVQDHLVHHGLMRLSLVVSQPHSS